MIQEKLVHVPESVIGLLADEAKLRVIYYYDV